jgi:predicted nuclease with TOPRIM domain
VESVATLSSRGSKCRCDDRAMGSLLELVEQRSKMDVYRQEKEALQRQVVRLEVANEDLRKQMRKLQGENLKVKELLR